MIIRFIRNNFKSNLLRSIVVILSFAVAVSLMLTTFNLSKQADKVFVDSSSKYDLVIGAKGSASQMVLNSIFFYDIPTGNIPYAEYEALKADERVANVIPLAMGDNLGGRKIVGTYPEYFGEDVKLSEGVMFTKTNEMVLGATVAKEQNLKIGDQVSGEHGVEAEAEAGEESHNHADFKYTIVGILEKTGTSSDIVAFTYIDSVWNVHEHHHEEETAGEHEEHEKEVTAILIKCHSYDQQAAITIEINDTDTMMAANVTTELRKLTTLLDDVLNIIKLIIVVVIIMSMLMMFLSMFTAVGERKREIAVMRAVGIGRVSVLGIVLLESVIMSVIGAIIGYLLSRILLAIGVSIIGGALGTSLSVFTMYGAEALVLVLTPVIGLIASLIPSIMVYRLEPTKYLR